MALDYQHWMVTVALVTSSLIALTANLLLLLVFCKRRGLRTISNRFTINLLLTNLLSSVLLIPLLIVEQQSPSASNQTTTILQLQNATFSDDFVLEDTKNELLQANIYEKAEQIIKHQLIFSENKSLDENKTDIKFSVLHHEITKQQRLSMVLCYLAQCTVGLVCTASILSVLLIGIDQYFAVIHSLRYYSYIDKFRSTSLIVASWLISILFAICGALTQSESHLWQFCIRNLNQTALSVVDFKSLNSIFAVIYFIFIILTPFVAICIIYVCIYAAAHNNSERMRKSTKNAHANIDTYMQIDKRAPSESRLDWKTNNEKEKKGQQGAKGMIKVQSAPNFTSLGKFDIESPPSEEALHTPVKRTSSDRVGFITNLKTKLSNASVFKYREETRAAKISLLVIFMVLICYLPYGLAVILNSQIVKIVIPASYNFVSLVLLILANIISPFLFVYRNRRIRRELLKFLRILPPKNSSCTWNTKRNNSILPVPVQQHKAIEEEGEKIDLSSQSRPFLSNGCPIPQVIITCKVENEKVEKESILKRVCSGKNWQNYKKCSFITVPESCWQTDSARGSFSSASTQSSLEE